MLFLHKIQLPNQIWPYYKNVERSSYKDLEPRQPKLTQTNRDYYGPVRGLSMTIRA